MPLRRRMLQLLVALALAYGGVCLLVFVFQRHLVFFPGGPPRATPEAAGLQFDELELVTDDGERIHAWRTRARPAAGRGLVLYSHGNGGSIETRIDRAAVFAGLGFDTLLYDYRGFGRSSGRPTEAGTYLDVLAVHAWAVTDGGYAVDEVIAFGESLGGAVAIELALRRPLAALVLESSFTSLIDMGRERYPFLPVRLLARDRYASIEKVSALELPILVMHSPDDEVVPFEQGRRLARAADAGLHELEGGHNDGGFVRRDADVLVLRRFLDEALGEALDAVEGSPAR